MAMLAALAAKVLRLETLVRQLQERGAIYSARVFNDADLSIVNGGSGTVLTFNSERYDNGGLHSIASNTSRLTVPVVGLYEIGAGVAFASNATGTRRVELLLNGSTVIAAGGGPADSGGLATRVPPVTTPYQLAAGDFIEVRCVQTSGGALNALALGNYSLEFWMTRLPS